MGVGWVSPLFRLDTTQPAYGLTFAAASSRWSLLSGNRLAVGNSCLMNFYIFLHHSGTKDPAG
jgi:hypothetical protein